MKTGFIHTFLALATISQGGFAKYEAHEWGTFTSMMGSNGHTQNGMYHEDEVLPSFVHGFGETRQLPQAPSQPQPRPRCRGKGCFDDRFLDENNITQKMETPVIHFYADKTEHVDVNVKFPKGLITETYPAPVRAFPTRRDLTNLRGGEVTFSVNVKPVLKLIPPEVPEGNIYGHARNVNSDLIESGGESEKFIFYRGLGEFQPKVQVWSQGGGLAIGTTKSFEPQAMFVIDVDATGNTRFETISRFGAYLSSAELAAFRTHGTDESGIAREEIVKALIEAGLYADEANAMLDTWQQGYLKVPGLRVLYILPQREADEILPLRMTPSPEKLVRVFVGRIEVLLASEEERVLQEIVTQREQFKVSALGRFAEPILRGVAQRYSGSDHQVSTLLARFIQEAAHTEVEASGSVR